MIMPGDPVLVTFSPTEVIEGSIIGLNKMISGENMSPEPELYAVLLNGSILNIHISRLKLNPNPTQAHNPIDLTKPLGE